MFDYKIKLHGKIAVGVDFCHLKFDMLVFLKFRINIENVSFNLSNDR